jgi:hypothetical protein
MIKDSKAKQAPKLPKLSEMSTDRLADVLIKLAPEIPALVGDEELIAKMRETTADKEKALTLGVEKATYIASRLLGKHRQSVYKILGALQGLTPNQIGEQPGLLTAKQLFDLFNDKELLDFF